MITFYYASGSPYAWRAWLGLEHKGAAYELKTLSFDKGDLQTPAFQALTPRGKVPVIVDDGFALWESAAILEYLEDKFAAAPRLFSADLRERATQRRLVREIDAYVVPHMEHLADAILFTPAEQQSEARIQEIQAEFQEELARWEGLTGDYVAGALSAADFTLYPVLALVERFGKRKPGAIRSDLIGPKLTRWMARMAALPVVRTTWPPHWK
jgi:glutathione S-transferase